VVTDPSLLTAPAFVADLDRVRESLGLARLTLLGHSWGSGLAALYAIWHPNRIERLLLVDPMPPRAEPYMTAFSQALLSRFTDDDRAAMAEAGARRRTAADADASDACRAYYALFIKGYLYSPTAQGEVLRTSALLGGANDQPGQTQRFRAATAPTAVRSVVHRSPIGGRAFALPRRERSMLLGKMEAPPGFEPGMEVLQHQKYL
jgi:pimeloyl-ACP methyl ester carboxylesterase